MSSAAKDKPSKASAEKLEAGAASASDQRNTPLLDARVLRWSL